MRERRIGKFRLHQPDSFPWLTPALNVQKQLVPAHIKLPRERIRRRHAFLRLASGRSPVDRPHSAASRYRNPPDSLASACARSVADESQIFWPCALKSFRPSKRFSKSSRLAGQSVSALRTGARAGIRVRRLQSVVGGPHRLHTIRQRSLRRQPPFGFRSNSGRIAERLQPKRVGFVEPALDIVLVPSPIRFGKLLRQWPASRRPVSNSRAIVVQPLAPRIGFLLKQSRVAADRAFDLAALLIERRPVVDSERCLRPPPTSGPKEADCRGPPWRRSP